MLFVDVSQPTTHRCVLEFSRELPFGGRRGPGRVRNPQRFPSGALGAQKARQAVFPGWGRWRCAFTLRVRSGGRIERREGREESFMPVEITGWWLKSGKEFGEDLFGSVPPGLKPRPPEEGRRADPPFREGIKGRPPYVRERAFLNSFVNPNERRRLRPLRRRLRPLRRLRIGAVLGARCFWRSWGSVRDCANRMPAGGHPWPFRTGCCAP
jgi:hypothetical protein